MFRFPNSLSVQVFKTFSIFYHNLHIWCHEHLKIFMIFKLHLNFTILKTFYLMIFAMIRVPNAGNLASFHIHGIWDISLLVKSGNTCHPRNVEFDEIHEISFQEGWTCEDLESWTCEAPKLWSCEDLESRTCVALKSRTYEDLESRTCEAPKSRTCEDLEFRTCEARSRKPAKILNLEPAKPRSREPVKIWNHELTKPRSRESVKIRSHESVKFGNPLKFEPGTGGVWRFPWMTDSWISKKPSQRR
jgi:hypothetical protein